MGIVRDDGKKTARIVVVGERGPIYWKDVVRFNSKWRVVSNGCHLWIGTKDRKGYAKFWWAGHTGRGSRFAVEVATKKVLGPGREPDHLCKTSSCVNPEHLEVVTRRENLRRGDSPIGHNYRKVQCKYGHPFSGQNLAIVVNEKGEKERRCRLCNAQRARLYRRR